MLQKRHQFFTHKKLETLHRKMCFHIKHNDHLLMNTVELIIYTESTFSCITSKTFSRKYVSSLCNQLAIFNNDNVTLVAYFQYQQFNLFPYGNIPVLFLYCSSEVLNLNLIEASKFCRKRQFIGPSDIAGTDRKGLVLLKAIFVCQSDQLPFNW